MKTEPKKLILNQETLKRLTGNEAQQNYSGETVTYCGTCWPAICPA